MRRRSRIAVAIMHGTGFQPSRRIRRAGWRWLARIRLALALSLCGCTHIITQNSDYYEDGPSQLSNPQGTIKEGTKAWVMGRDGSYVRVWTEDGVNAYVWDRAVMTLWDWQRKQDEIAKQNRLRESLARQNAELPTMTTPPPASQPAKKSDAARR